jgi:hypothetical protein
MIRRRRRGREIPFSFDSFLDIVANVVGIIIRLILVVWVGARSYSSVKSNIAPAGESPAAVAAEIRLPDDPLQAELEQHRRELALVQKQLLTQLRELQDMQATEARVTGELASLGSEKEKLERERLGLNANVDQCATTAQQAALSSEELRQRYRRLAAEIRTLEREPVAKRTLHYRTPVSQPLHSEELLFECKQGRVTFIDIAALLAEVRRGLEDKGKLLRAQWQVQEVTPPVGAFRLHYVVERDRELLDALGSQAAPPSTGNYRYGLSEWQLEATAPYRGETLSAALAPGSEFRQIVDGIDPQQTAVTFWVYPDSFEVFRRLRDALYGRDIVVAGRPLPDGVPIASSRRGTVSRGQ